jgi:energy-coupling factor transporter ATP-binding protein EcfA2
MINKSVADSLLRDSLLLKGKLLYLEEDVATTTDLVEEAKYWIQKYPDYLKFLEHLQNILQEKNVKTFSNLLTSFVKDVLNKDKNIVFNLHTSRGAPALKIEASNDGNIEDIYNGSGGSITNIISTGLRLIALSRSPNRKFIVLDEQDCWLKPEHVPVFAKIIGEISKQLNIQTVIISHHNWEYFKNYGRVIELKNHGGILQSEIIHDTENENIDGIDLIKSVSLKRFMSHFDTKFELHKNLTCIVGENDIGKSVFATALKSVAYGDSSDSFVKHGENSAQVLIELTGNRQILWERFVVTNQVNPQKVKFSYFLNNQFLKSEFLADGAPDFIYNELLLSLLDNIDIHIGNQKQPVFLLSDSVKPQERAKILSLGKESILIQKMMEIIKDKKRVMAQNVKNGEAKLFTMSKQISVLENVDLLSDKAKELLQISDLYNKTEIHIKEIDDFINGYSNVMTLCEIGFIQKHVADPELIDLNDVLYFVKQYDELKPIKNLEFVKYLTDDFYSFHSFKSIEDLSELIKELSYLIKYYMVLPIKHQITDFELNKVEFLDSLIESLDELTPLSNFKTINYDLSNYVLENIDEINDLINKIATVMGLSCVDKVSVFEEFFEIKNFIEINDLLTELTLFKRISNIGFADFNVVDPVVENIEHLNVTAKEIEHVIFEKENLIDLRKEIQKDINKVDIDIREYFNIFGENCPTCHQHVTETVFGEHVDVKI